MKLWRWLLLATVAALALLLHGDDDSPATASASSSAPLGDFAPGEVLVKVRPGLPAERIPDLDVVRIDLPSEMEVAEAVELYERLPWVEFAEPNYYLRADVVEALLVPYPSRSASI